MILGSDGRRKASGMQKCFPVLASVEDGSEDVPAGVMQIYERVAIAKWIHLHHTVPHSPATPALLRDLKPCPEMERLIRQLQREFGLRLQAQTAPV